MRETIRSFLLISSAIAFAGGLVWGGVVFWNVWDGGHFFSGYRVVASLSAAGEGLLLSFLLNAIAWGLGVRSRRFTWIIALQTPFAFWMIGVVITGLQKQTQAHRCSEQRTAIDRAIKADDPAAFDAASPHRDDPCQDFVIFSNDLAKAANQGAIRVAQHLVASGVRIEGYDRGENLYSCEGSSLSALSGLSVAVARENLTMVELFLPVSDKAGKEKALLTAAELDRMAMIQVFLAANVPLPTASPGYESILNSLLVAAASGAALEVGQWLLSERPVPISQNEIQKAMQELYHFARSVEDTPRIVLFAKLLIAHGADINAPFDDQPTFLHQAIETQDGRMARLLLALGADLLQLFRDERDSLNMLLAQPENKVASHKGSKGCVAP